MEKFSGLENGLESLENGLESLKRFRCAQVCSWQEN
jgi:hypothetical protein